MPPSSSLVERVGEPGRPEQQRRRLEDAAPLGPPQHGEAQRVRAAQRGQVVPLRAGAQAVWVMGNDALVGQCPRPPWLSGYFRNKTATSGERRIIWPKSSG